MPTRRGFLVGAGLGVGLGVAAVAGGVPLLNRIWRRSGKLLDPLLASHGFTVARAGGSADWPEMSLLAYDNAVNHGADALEVSLARTSDGVWFGLHDRTLDRTSGTTGFVASEHAWDEVSRHRISAAETHDPTQPTQPYMRFEQLTDRYASDHTIFVDPKYVPPLYYGELFHLMRRSTTHDKQTYVAKSYYRGTPWARAARARGYATWGYYYASEIEADPAILETTQSSWDLLGLDYGGSVAAWEAARSFGKHVIAHVIPDRRAAALARSKGADGLMISGIAEVLQG